jgi:hypothetical protein
MVTACLEYTLRGDQQFVFTVPLPEREPVFMSMDIDKYTRDGRAVVVVDSAKFLALWRADPNNLHRDVAMGSPKTWPSDYKYHWVVDGFSYGHENPVPLADVHHYTAPLTISSSKFLGLSKREWREEVEAVGFMNGITRTIWLLTQGCQAFPVKCSPACMVPLANAAAVSGSLPYTVGDLAAIGSMQY